MLANSKYFKFLFDCCDFRVNNLPRLQQLLLDVLEVREEFGVVDGVVSGIVPGNAAVAAGAGLKHNMRLMVHIFFA